MAPASDDNLAQPRSAQALSRLGIVPYDFEVAAHNIKKLARSSRMISGYDCGGLVELAFSLVVNLDRVGHTSRATRRGRPRPNASLRVRPSIRRNAVPLRRPT